MSILIKGMEMPTSCGFCLFENHTDDGYECRINGCLTEYQNRPSDCPLVPVPPHGRLIDADALMRHCVMLPRDGGSLPVVYASYVSNAPIIIPAEEGE